MNIHSKIEAIMKKRRISDHPATIAAEETAIEYGEKVMIMSHLPLIENNINFPNVGINHFQEMINALTVVMNGHFTNITNRFTNISNELALQSAAVRSMDAKLYNVTAIENDDNVRPPQLGNNPPPDNFPRTIGQVKGLQAGQLMTNIENYYGLSHQGNCNTRIRRIQRAYGIRSVQVDVQVTGG